MKQHSLVSEQFGSKANAYLSSAVHARGEDLTLLQQVAGRFNHPRTLDLGCGAGHVSFAVSPHAGQVVAYDLSEKMLAVVSQAAKERQLNNIETLCGPAEKLPFDNEQFDLVITRFSAHHWRDVPRALGEVNRVLAKDGIAVIIDIVSPEEPLYDTTLQAAEVLRDASHVRDYRISEWRAMLQAASLAATNLKTWKLTMVFDDWIARMQTPAERTQAIRSLFDCAPEEVQQYFSVQSDHSFSIDAALFEISKVE